MKKLTINKRGQNILTIEGFDNDREICIETDNDYYSVTTGVYLGVVELNQIVQFLTDQLKEINEFNPKP